MNQVSENLQKIIISTAVAPQRGEARHASEMVNELLLGETAQLLETDETGRWLKVRADHDGYEGWVSVAQAFVYEREREGAGTASETGRFSINNTVRNQRTGMLLRRENGNLLRVPLGACLPQEENGTITFIFGNCRIENPGVPLPADLMQAAKNFAGIPYLWGGRSDFGIDCSGLVQQWGFLCGIPLPRDASMQIKAYPLISKDLKDAQAADLVYFSFDGIRIVHVGLYCGDGLLLHASGDVRIECIDSDKRNATPFMFNERLAGAVAGIQRPGFPYS